MVLDRLFLYVFGITAFFGSLMILSESPKMSEDVSPIDIIYSKIAAEESRMFEEKLFAWKFKPFFFSKILPWIECS